MIEVTAHSPSLERSAFAAADRRGRRQVVAWGGGVGHEPAPQKSTYPSRVRISVPRSSTRTLTSCQEPSFSLRLG